MNRLHVMLCFLSLAAFINTAASQDTKRSSPPTQNSTYQAPVSCTVNVPTELCRLATQEFGTLQEASRVMGQIEVVIADGASFKQENDRLIARHQRATQAAAQANSTVNFFGLLSREPVAPSGLDGDVLFVLEDQGMRSINKVVVSSELFRVQQPHPTDKPSSDKNNSTRIVKDDYDPSLISMWSKYVIGYVEGWYWGRMQQLAEQSAEPPK